MAGLSNLPPEFFMQLGGGILSGQNLGDGLGQGLQNASTSLTAQRQKQEETQQQSATYEALKRIDPEKAELFKSKVLTGPQAYSLFAEEKAKREAASKPSYKWMNIDGKLVRIDENSGAVEEQADFSGPKKRNLVSTKSGIYDADTNQWIAPPEGMGTEDGVKRGLTPVWGTKNGKRVLGTLGEDGSFQETKLPDGFEPTPGTSTVDLGTTIGVRDNKSGEIIRQVPKDIAGAEEQKIVGKTRGENVVSLPDTIAKSEQALSVIDQAISHPGREKTTGWNSTFDPRTYLPGTDSADFQAVAGQIEGKAFLEAFESLKGGGQITEVEGKKATQAVARLSTSQSDEAYKEALLELREVVAAGLQRAKAKASSTPVAVDPATAAKPTVTNGKTTTGISFTAEPD